MDRIKTPIALAIMLALLCALLCGCGGKDAGKRAPAVVTPKVLTINGSEPGTPAPTSAPTPSSEPASKPTPEPTSAPAPEPEKIWFEGSGLHFTEQGAFSFYTDLSSAVEGAKNEALEAEFAVDPAEKVGGTDRKIIQATLQITPHLFTFENDQYRWSWCAMYGFLDQYTGRMIVCEIEDGEQVDTTIDFGGKSYDITLAFSMLSTGSYVDLGYSSKLLPAQMVFTLTCPEDYEGAAFFVSGCSSDDFDIYVAEPIGHYDTFDNSGYDFFVVDGNK